MNKIYTSPFDWGYIDDNTLIYEGGTSEEIKKMVDEALDEALDDVLDGVVEDAVDKMDIRLEGSDLLYRLMVNGTENGEINIPKDQFLQSASYDSENKQLVFVIGANGDQGTEVRVAVEDLVSAIEAKNAEQDTKNDQQDEAIENVQAALADKADTTYVDEKVASVEVPDVSGFATKEEVAAVDAKVDSLVIPSVEGLATEAYVDEKVAAVEIPDVSGLATKEEVNAVDAKVEAIDLTPYATAQALADEVDRATTKESGIEEALNQEAQRATNAESELSGKDTQLQANIDAVDAKVNALVIPSVEGLATEAYVDEKVAAVEIPDVSGFATKEEVAAVDAKVEAIDLTPYATKEEVAAVDTKVAAKADTTYVDEKNGLQDDAISAINDLVEGLSDTKVDWVASTPGRKHIVLENHDSILGTATTGDTYNLAMVSKWDVADFGSTSLHLNLNTKDGVATINDNKNIATEDFVNSAVAAVEVPDVSGFATKEEVNAVDAKVEAIDLTPYATKTEVETAAAGAVAQIVANAPEDLDTLKEVAEYIATDKTKASEIETKLSQHDAAIEAKADQSEVDTLATKAELEEVDEKVDAIVVPDVSGFAVASEVTTQIANAVADKANVSDIPTRTSELENDSNFITSHQSLEEYAKKAYVSEKIAEVVGGAPETLDTLKEIADALSSDEGTLETIAAAIETKANADDVYTKGNIDDKIGDLGVIVEVEGQEATYWEDGDELPEGVEVGDIKTPAVEEVTREKSVKEYVDESVQTVNEKPEVMVLERKYGALLTLLNLRDTDINNTIINQELVESNVVTYEDGSVDNIIVPETTKSKTITAELEPDTDLTLTSRYGVTINNTGEQPTDLTVTAPAVENYNAATITLNGGEYDTITVTDASLTVQNGASVQNVVITQETTKNLTINAMFAEGATVTSGSNAAITLTSKNPEGEEVSVVLDAPGSTVTMNNGNWVNVEASVSQNTLIINNTVHIENLNVTQGNVTVKVARQADIANVVEDYILAAGCTIDYLHDDITASNVSKLTSTGTHTLVEDIAKNGRFAPGIFASDDIVWNLNGHNITFTNTQGYANFLLRGSLHLEINGEGNVINNAGDYGFWAAAEGVKIVVNGGHFEAATHVLYAEKGTIEVNGGSFKLTNPDECDKDANGNFKFLLNCKDENYTAGTANIIVRGGKFYGFNPAVTYGEPSGPVSYVAQGYHVVESVEDGMKVYTVVAD